KSRKGPAPPARQTSEIGATSEVCRPGERCLFRFLGTGPRGLLGRGGTGGSRAPGRRLAALLAPLLGRHRGLLLAPTRAALLAAAGRLLPFLLHRGRGLVPSCHHLVLQKSSTPRGRDRHGVRGEGTPQALR